MTIETGIENAGVYIDALDDTYPADGDDLVEGDNHIRGIKNTLLNTFPNITGAVTPTHTELNYVDGVTSAIQTQLDAKINTTDNNQSIDASGTTNDQLFTLGSASITNYSRLHLDTDSNEFRIEQLGSTSANPGETWLTNVGAQDIRLRTGGNDKAIVRHAGGLSVSNDAPATPTANTLYADSMIKAWAEVRNTATTPAPSDDFNVTNITDIGVGSYQVNLTTGMANATYAVVGSAYVTGGASHILEATSSSTTVAEISIRDDADAPADADFNVIVVGSQ